MLKPLCYIEMDIGGREEQQDSTAYFTSADGAMMVVVADGMGGHKGGAMASQTICNTVEKYWQSLSWQQNEIRDSLEDLCLACHEQVNQIAADFPDVNPRSTVIMLYIKQNYAAWIHVGDSRLYWFRNEAQMHRTKDHSVIQMMVDMGEMTQEEAQNSSEKNLLTQSVGGEKKPKPRFYETDSLEQNDLFLLCSDGFWDQIDIEYAIQKLSYPGKDKKNIKDLVARAAQKGGVESDNISLAMVRMQSVKPQSQSLSVRQICFFFLGALIGLLIGILALLLLPSEKKDDVPSRSSPIEESSPVEETEQGTQNSRPNNDKATTDQEKTEDKLQGNAQETR